MRSYLPDEAPTSVFLVFFFQIIMLFCLLFALVYGVMELTLFSLLILTLGFGSYLWSLAGLRHAGCTITLNSERFFSGERLKINIRVKNSKLLPALFKVNFFVPMAVTGSGKGQWISEEISLLWYQQADFSRDFYPNNRGVYDLGPPLLRGGDLFGFYFRNIKRRDRFEIVVYPRIVNILPVALLRKEFFGIPGAQSPVEDPLYVFGTRDYQPGRPARGIHWKASARHNRLQEKLCEPAEQEKVLILLDVEQFDNEEAAEDFERSLEVIASLIIQMDRRGIAIGFVTNGKILGERSKIIPISRSPRQLVSILEVLARMSAEKDGNVTDILSRAYSVPWGVSSIYFSYNGRNQTRSARGFMKHRNIPVRFVMVKKTNNLENTDDSQEKDILYLDNILVSE